MKLIIVNSNKSTTVGGVESLMRSLYGLDIGRELIEFFCKIGSREVYPENKKTAYVDYSVNNRFGIFSKIALKINQIRSLKHSGAGTGDVIVLFHPNDLLYMPFSVLKRATIILVQTNRFDIYFKPLSKIIISLTKHYIDHVTVYTKQDKAALARLYPALGNKAKVIPRGCRLARSETLRPCSKKLVTVARIDEDQKDFTAMLEIFSRLPGDYTLDIYGGGTQQEVDALKYKVSKVTGAHFKGEVSDNLSEVLQQYSVFLMTSRYEGFGQTLIEARSQGLPVVVFNNFDALSFIVEDGYNGFTINNNDKNLFAHKIRELCEDETLFETMSRNALSKAEETEAAHIDDLWKVIL